MTSDIVSLLCLVSFPFLTRSFLSLCPCTYACWTVSSCVQICFEPDFEMRILPGSSLQDLLLHIIEQSSWGWMCLLGDLIITSIVLFLKCIIIDSWTASCNRYMDDKMVLCRVTSFWGVFFRVTKIKKENTAVKRVYLMAHNIKQLRPGSIQNP